jgi:hypothetical protein
MINTLKDWIETQLETVTELTGRVYTFVDDNTEFPCALINFIGTQAEEQTTNTNWRTYSFRIRVQYDLSSGTITEDNIDTYLYDIVDSIIDLFDTQRRASGNAHILSPVGGRLDWLDTNRSIRYTDITLDFKKVTNAS